VAIGFAVYFFNYSIWLGRNGLYLEDLYVAPEHRQRGAGKRLLRQLTRIATGESGSRFECLVLDWNAPAIGFYQSVGAKVQDEWTVYRMGRCCGISPRVERGDRAVCGADFSDGVRWIASATLVAVHHRAFPCVASKSASGREGCVAGRRKPSTGSGSACVIGECWASSSGDSIRLGITLSISFVSSVD
jgi:hypothetical protein